MFDDARGRHSRPIPNHNASNLSHLLSIPNSLKFGPMFREPVSVDLNKFDSHCCQILKILLGVFLMVGTINLNHNFSVLCRLILSVGIERQINFDQFFRRRKYQNVYLIFS